MGEVYKARDTRLNRTVALKVSKEQFTDRFEREARAVASLNHPNICTLHDVGPNYLVMEYIEGAPLQGPMPVAKAVEYAVQILDALDAAHQKGLTHRDLKPANILVAKTGVKLLDFGLAKFAHPAPLAGAPDDATLTMALTGKNEIVGTLQYMSPEQLKGQEADSRSDLFSFGCVLYEMLSGRRAFGGASAAATIGAIMHSEPPPLESIGPLQKVISRCLAKDPENRFQTARDLRAAILWAVEAEPPSRTVRANRSRWMAAALVPIAGLAWLWMSKAPPVATPLIRFQVPMPGESSLRHIRLALSPDGQYLAFISANQNRRRQIFLRRLDSSASKPLRNTEGAYTMVWSADSRSLAFSDNGPLRRVDIDGGNLRTLTESSGAYSSNTWSGDGTILFKLPGGGGPLQQIPARGGATSSATTMKADQSEISHVNPSFLPDNRHFIFQSLNAYGMSSIEMASLGSADRKRVMESNNPAVSVTGPDGETYLAYQRDKSLMLQAVDWRSGAIQGEPVAIVDNLGEIPESIPFSFSKTGALAYSSSSTSLRRLVWYDRAGKQLDELATNGSELGPALSPDGRRLAVMRSEGSGTRDVWVADLSRKTWRRISFGEKAAINPVWSPDGKKIAYTVGASTGSAILEKDSEGTGEEREIGKATPWPQDWSPDGRQILYVDYATRILMAMPAEGGGKPIALTSKKASYYPASYSPDGKYVTYTSGESGRLEVYVMALPPAQGKWLVSTDGGGMSAWRGDGKELFYLSEDLKMMAVDIKLNPQFEAGPPRPLFQTGVTSLIDGRNHYVVTRDGQKFLISSPANSDGVSSMEVVLNWPALLKKGAPRD